MLIVMSEALMIWGHCAFMIGQALAAILQRFVDLEAWPQMFGIPVPALWLLIPIWLILAAGVLVSLIAWFRFPTFHKELDLSDTHDIEQRPDGTTFGPFVRHLGGFTATLLCMGCVGNLVIMITADEPDLAAISGLYWMACLTMFTCYLVWRFDSTRDIVITNYLKTLWVLWAFLAIPVAWPAVVVLHFRHRNHDNTASS